MASCAAGLVLSAVALATPKTEPPAGCKWQEIPEIKVAIAVPEGWHFRKLPTKGKILAYEVIPAGDGIPSEARSRYELRFQRLERPGTALARAREHVENAVATSVDASTVDEATIGVMKSFSAVGHLSADSGGVPQLTVAVSAIGNPKTGALYTVRFEIPTPEAESVLPMGNVLFRAIVVDDEV